MIGYNCEAHWGFWRMMWFYFSTAFGASLLSCVGSPCTVSVGASGALMGIIGAYMAWLLLNWNNTAVLQAPCQRMCNMIWWLFIIFMIGLSAKGIDNLAHVGGCISGLMIGFIFCTPQDPISWVEGKEKIYRYVATFLFTVYFVSTLVSTFALINCAKFVC
jgi:membrane associated rhomboid family serine protease